jgi:hypothetical protein
MDLVLNHMPRHFRSVILSCLAVLAASVVAAEPVAEALTPLPPGAVQPQGWLRDWAVSQAKGLTGNLDAYDETHVFAMGWTCEPIQIPGAKAAKHGWPLEQSGYWIDGVVRLGHVLHDDALLDKVRPRLEKILGTDNPTGTYFWWRPVSDKPVEVPTGFFGWSSAVLGRALAAQSLATGDAKWLQATTRYLEVIRNQPGWLALWRHHAHLESLYEAHRIGIDQNGLWTNQAASISRGAPGLSKELDQWAQHFVTKEVKGMTGHGVTFNETAKIPIIYYLMTGDERLKQTALDRYQLLYERHMLPYGVNSGSEGICGIGAFRSTETCNVSDLIWGTTWMLRALGDGRYGDRIEAAFFNAAPGCISRDCTLHSYYQAPNRIDTKRQGAKFAGGGPNFSKTHQPLCCSGNITRILPNYVIHMWMRTADHGLAATLYGPNTVKTTVAGNVGVELVTATDYPFNETIRIAVKPLKTARFPLAFRIPAWCTAPEVTLNDKPVASARDAHGYVRIERDWADGDAVTLRFPMPPRVVTGRETEGSPYACVYAGPLLFARAIPEKDENTPADGTWKYALDFDAARPVAAMSVERKAMPAHWDWPAAAPVTLTVPAQAIDWEPVNTHEGALPDEPVPGKGAETIQLIPYGCAKFRVSMFPVTVKAWGKQE